MSLSAAGLNRKWHNPTTVLIGLAVAALAVFGVASRADGSTPTTTTASTGPAVETVGGDLANVAEEVAGVQISIAEIAQNWTQANAATADMAPGSNISVQNTIDELTSSTRANDEAIDGLAETANDAFPDLLAQLKSDNVSTGIMTATTDLGNAMGALVAYAGKPSPAALNSFSSALTASVSEWNSAVKADQNLTGTPPTIGAG
ncbi:MAG: hypothetical protein ACLPVY_00120 [Acidimicrobiia bacterium]